MRTVFKPALYMVAMLTTGIFLVSLWLFVRRYGQQDDYLGYLLQIPLGRMLFYGGLSTGLGLLGLWSVVQWLQRWALDRYDRNQALLRQLVAGETAHIQGLLPEFSWLAKEIQRTLKNHDNSLQAIKNQQQHMYTLMNDMQAGVVLLDEDFYIVFINHQARQWFGLQQLRKRYRFTQLYRNEQLLRPLYYLHETGNTTVDLTLDTRTLRASLGVTDNGYTLYVQDVSQLLQHERLQRDFSANVSHALKTPVTSIMGFAQLIGTGMVTDPAQIQTMGETIATKSADMVKLIDDILQLTYLEHMEQQTYPAVQVQPIAQSVLDGLSSQAQSSQLTLTLVGEATACVHPTHLKELLLNLVENGIKYNVPQGNVCVELSNTFKGQLRLVVKDTGIGMSAADTHRVQQRYYRVPSAIAGNGLGLNIVDTLVKRYGGQLVITSTQGEGTQVTLTL